MSLGVGAHRVGGPRQCSSMRRRYPWQPCEQPPPGTIKQNNSVEYLPTNTYLALTSRGSKGWEKPKNKKACKQHTIATTLCKELQAGNCEDKSWHAPARGIGPPPVYLERLLNSTALRLTLPKLHLAPFNILNFTGNIITIHIATHQIFIIPPHLFPFLSLLCFLFWKGKVQQILSFSGILLPVMLYFDESKYHRRTSKCIIETPMKLEHSNKSPNNPCPVLMTP